METGFFQGGEDSRTKMNIVLRFLYLVQKLLKYPFLTVISFKGHLVILAGLEQIRVAIR